MLKVITLFGLLEIALVQLLSQPLFLVNERVNQKLDMNDILPSYVDIENLKYCSPSHGIFCNEINHKLPLDSYSNDFLKKRQQYLDKVDEAIQIFLKYHKQNNVKYEVFYQESKRKLLDQALNYMVHELSLSIKFVFDFSNIQPSQTRKLFPFSYIMNPDDKTYSVTQDPGNIESYETLCTFENIYVPSANEYKEYLKSQQRQSKDQITQHYPAEMYLLTQKEDGMIRFSKPVSLISLSVKQSTWKLNQKLIRYFINLYKNGETLYEVQHLEHNEPNNIWLSTYGPRNDITAIMIPPDTLIDSIILEQQKSTKFADYLDKQIFSELSKTFRNIVEKESLSDIDPTQINFPQVNEQ